MVIFNRRNLAFALLEYLSFFRWRPKKKRQESNLLGVLQLFQRVRIFVPKIVDLNLEGPDSSALGPRYLEDLY